MKTAKMQLRGHCQVCGNEQAVVRGNMSKHGYSIVHGWFSGVCHGQHHQPIEVSRVYTDHVIARITEDCIELKSRISDLLSGAIKPDTLQFSKYENRKWVEINVPVSELSPVQYREGFNRLVGRLEQRISNGQRHIALMTELADKFHGKPLIEVDTQADKPEVIQVGEKRILGDHGVIGTVMYLDGARVHYKYAGLSTGKVLTTWQSSRTWRGLQKVS